MYEEIHFDQMKTTTVILNTLSCLKDHAANTAELNTDMNVAYQTSGKHSIMTMTECSAYNYQLS